MSSDAKLRQIASIINVFKLKRDRLKQDIYKIEPLISKKNQSVQTLEKYLDSYTHQWNDFSNNTIHMIGNNRLFYKQLDDLIQSEKKEIKKLDIIKRNLIDNYQTLDRKINGLMTLHDEICREIQKTRDNAEEASMLELYSSRH